jgi:hypothetical protein
MDCPVRVFAEKHILTKMKSLVVLHTQSRLGKRKGVLMKGDITEKTREVRNHKNRDRHSEAQERQEYRDTLSNSQQVSGLDIRLGHGIGATKERERLMQ